MTNPFIMKLGCGVDLTDEDRVRLQAVASPTRHVGARKDLITEGERPESVHVVLEGFACRYKILPDGKRQIMAYLIPGDWCDLHAAVLGEMDHSVATLTPCTIVEIPRETVEDLTVHYPRITRALWWASLVDEATLREWLVNIGQRPADQRMAHLLCELLVRLQAVGRASENSYELPPTQVELSDTLGMSPVHVNRTLQQLRRAGLITLRGKALIVHDVERLNEFAGFNPNYLHLRRRRTNRQDPQRRTLPSECAGTGTDVGR